LKDAFAPDGIWRITSYLIPIAPEHEAAAEAAIAKEADDEVLVLVDGVAEAMVRHAIAKTLANLTHAEARETFMRRLARSRFAITIH
jgi:hypothetical protein